MQIKINLFSAIAAHLPLLRNISDMKNLEKSNWIGNPAQDQLICWHKQRSSWSYRKIRITEKYFQWQMIYQIRLSVAGKDSCLLDKAFKVLLPHFRYSGHKLFPSICCQWFSTLMKMNFRLRDWWKWIFDYAIMFCLE